MTISFQRSDAAGFVQSATGARNRGGIFCSVDLWRRINSYRSLFSLSPLPVGHRHPKQLRDGLLPMLEIGGWVDADGEHSLTTSINYDEITGRRVRCPDISSVLEKMNTPNPNIVTSLVITYSYQVGGSSGSMFDGHFPIGLPFSTAENLEAVADTYDFAYQELDVFGDSLNNLTAISGVQPTPGGATMSGSTSPTNNIIASFSRSKAAYTLVIGTNFEEHPTLPYFVAWAFSAAFQWTGFGNLAIVHQPAGSSLWAIVTQPNGTKTTVAAPTEYFTPSFPDNLSQGYQFGADLIAFVTGNGGVFPDSPSAETSEQFGEDETKLASVQFFSKYTPP